MAHKYTNENIDWLATSRPLYAEQELSAKFHQRFKVLISPAALVQQCCKRGFKPPAVNIGRIKKGNIPFNKGLKGRRVSMVTEFKKGNRPKNSQALGTEVFRNDYWYIKVEPNKWTAKHRAIWETAYGELPKGLSVIFIDSDITNFALDNLATVTKAELLQMNRNKYKQMNNELKPSLLALSRLEASIYKISKDSLCPKIAK
jgi:hypothetical protein